MFVTSEYRFSAAHQIPHHPLCKTLHGHTYRLVVTLRGKIDPRTGMVIDFDQVREVVGRQVLSLLDHAFLNEIVELPTSELLVVWIWNRLAEALPELDEVRLYEQPETCVSYRGEPEPFLQPEEP